MENSNNLEGRREATAQTQGEEPFFHKKNLEIDYFPDSNCHKHFVQLMQNDFCVFREEKYLTFFKEKMDPTCCLDCSVRKESS